MASRTIKLVLEYDGTDFVGWQYQENGRSVQEVVEHGLSQILREEIRIVGAGRTDSGVHAKGQVASFQTESSLNCEKVLRGLNGVLPGDVVALEAEDVVPNFNARFDAQSRTYEYVIKRIPTALSRKYSWVLRYRLDIELMNQCANAIVGVHDFTSFCKSDSEVVHHNCTVIKALWTSPDPASLMFTIVSDRFLHGMVRTLVGTMIDIGRGYRRYESFDAILKTKDRKSAGMAAPPQGLFLIEVKY